MVLSGCIQGIVKILMISSTHLVLWLEHSEVLRVSPFLLLHITPLIMSCFGKVGRPV
jgi:hypothetical protein